MKIFVMNGQGGTGKTTFQNLIAQYCDGAVAQISMVSYVKTVAAAIGWDGSKEPRDRKMLSQLKDLLTEYNDSPFLSTVGAVKQMEQDNVAVCFIDAREPNDIDRLKETLDCQTVLVIRGEQKSYGNHADDEVFNYQYDIVIDNSGSFEDLKDCAQTFVEEFINE